jgi:hypothetical protein
LRYKGSTSCTAPRPLQKTGGQAGTPLSRRDTPRACPSGPHWLAPPRLMAGGGHFLESQADHGEPLHLLLGGQLRGEAVPLRLAARGAGRGWPLL